MNTPYQGSLVIESGLQWSDSADLSRTPFSHFAKLQRQFREQSICSARQMVMNSGGSLIGSDSSRAGISPSLWEFHGSL
jgi:hypothetical protein